MKAHMLERSVTLRNQIIIYSIAITAMVLVLIVMSSPAFAGADTTFDTVFNKFKGYVEGSGGKIIAILSLAGGVLGMARGGFSLGQVALPVGVGVGLGYGVPIVTSSVTALI